MTTPLDEIDIGSHDVYITGVPHELLTRLRHEAPVFRHRATEPDHPRKYADTDARITLMLMLRQKWEIENNGAGNWLWDDEPANHAEAWGRVYEKVERRLSVTKVLYRMTRRALPYDEITSRVAAEECRKRAAKGARRLPFGPTEAKAKHYFFEEGVTDKGEPCLDLVPYAVTDKGAPSLTAEILGRMVTDRVPHADVWADPVEDEAALAKFLEAIFQSQNQKTT